MSLPNRCSGSGRMGVPRWKRKTVEVGTLFEARAMLAIHIWTVGMIFFDLSL